MKLKVLLLAGLATTILAGPAFALEISEESRIFIDKATIGNMFEVSASKVALDKAQRQDVHQFARMMIDDHSKTSVELQSLIAANNINAEPPRILDEKHQESLNALQETDVEDFDEDYIEAQIDAHQEAIELFQDYAENGDNQILQQFAIKTLPALRQHESHIRKLDEVE